MKRLLPVLIAAALLIAAAGRLAAAEQGIASWYGGKFHGRLTANGEIFDTNKLTAAHRTLPFDTRVKVTSLNTGKSVVVRINDRGPFLHGRIIDLSQAAAMKIGMLESGTAPVTVEVLDGTEVSANPASPAPGAGNSPSGGSAEAASAASVTSASPSPPVNLAGPELPEPSLPETVRSEGPPDRKYQDAAGPEAALRITAASSAVPVEPVKPAAAVESAPPVDSAFPARLSGERFRIQLGSFSVHENALSLKSRLEREGFLPRLEPAGDFTRVVLTGLSEREVSRILSSLERAGFSDYLVRED